MALFGRKKKEEVKKGEDAAKPVAMPQDAPAFNAGAVLLRPRITEKAAILGEHNVYAFDVAKGVTGNQVKTAVKAIFKVTPAKVRFVSVPSKIVATRSTGKKGKKSGGRKAYVQLKAGDKIELI